MVGARPGNLRNCQKRRKGEARSIGGEGDADKTLQIRLQAQHSHGALRAISKKAQSTLIV